MDKFLSHTGDTYQVDRAWTPLEWRLVWHRARRRHRQNVHSRRACRFRFRRGGRGTRPVLVLVIVGLFAFIVLRGFSRLRHENSLFVVLAVSGLLIEFGLQAVINWPRPCI